MLCYPKSTHKKRADQPGVGKKSCSSVFFAFLACETEEAPSAEMQKKYLRQHSVLDWSPTSILSGPCDACLRGSDETRKVHRGMAADEVLPRYSDYIPLKQHFNTHAQWSGTLYRLCLSRWNVRELKLTSLPYSLDLLLAVSQRRSDILVSTASERGQRSFLEHSWLSPFSQ